MALGTSGTPMAVLDPAPVTCSFRGHQLSAFYDAGWLWLDEVKDDERATAAFEAAAALDVTYEDVFDRLSRLYAARKLPSAHR